MENVPLKMLYKLPSHRRMRSPAT